MPRPVLKGPLTKYFKGNVVWSTSFLVFFFSFFLSLSTTYVSIFIYRIAKLKFLLSVSNPRFLLHSLIWNILFCPFLCRANSWALWKAVLSSQHQQILTHRNRAGRRVLALAPVSVIPVPRSLRQGKMNFTLLSKTLFLPSGAGLSFPSMTSPPSLLPLVHQEA